VTAAAEEKPKIKNVKIKQAIGQSLKTIETNKEP
jgi:hypothetical protein